MMRECDESRGWGYLRETREMARKAAEKAPESVFSGLDEYLEYLFPGRVWVHDTRFGGKGVGATLSSVPTTFVKTRN